MNKLVYHNSVSTIHKCGSDESAPINIRKFSHLSYLCSCGGKKIIEDEKKANIAATTKICPYCGCAILGNFIKVVE